MKLRYFIVPMALAALVGTTSCSDFLTEDPKGQVTPTGFFDSQKSLDAAVNALYYNVQQSQCNSNPMIVQCQGSDITSTTGSNKGAYLSADAFEVPTDTKGLQWLWAWQYTIIQASNLIIDNAASVPVAQQNINEALGQAYFWRAYAYFQLVRVFGPLPVNLHNVPDNNTTPLTDVAGIYSLIEADLIAAEKCNLPGSYSDQNKSVNGMNVYITAQAVKSLQAAVYMNMAGFPLNKDGYYEKAADAAYAVYEGVKNGTYNNSLCASWADVYSYGNNHSRENVVAMVYRDVTGGWSNFDSQLSSCHQLGTVEGGWGDLLPERHFWAQFPEGPRKDYVYAKQLRYAEGVTYDWWATTDGQAYDGTNAVNSAYRPMFVGFTVNADAAGQPAKAPFDYTAPFWGGMCINKTHQIIRLSEVYCWLAESAARSGKHIDAGEDALRQVMARAYTTVPAITDMATQALKEHGYEVAGNACALVTRRADEFRTNTLEEAWAYRHGPQDAVLVPKGTLTHSVGPDGQPFTYELPADLKLKENMDVNAQWNGLNSIYQIYPPKESEKNPNLKR